MKPTFLTYICVGIGGMLGASLRYFIDIWIQNPTSHFPWATFSVNLTGAFLLSFLLFLPITKEIVAPFILTGVTTGILGSYTTFSTFTLEIIQLVEAHPFISLSYLLFSIVGGLGCSFMGYKLARLVPKGGKNA